MKGDKDKTKGQLLDELKALRDRVAELERTETDHKQAEKALQAAVVTAEEERTKSEAIVAAIGDSLSIQDTDFKILYQNPVSKDIIGDHVGVHCYKAFEGREHVCEGCPLVMSFKDGKIHTVERSVSIDTGIRCFENTASPLKDSTGKIVAGIEIGRDITDRKRAEEDLRLQSEIAANMSEGVYLVRVNDLIIVYANPKFEGMFGYGPGEMVGKHVSIINAPTDKDPQDTANEIRRSLEKNGYWNGEVRNIKKDGTQFWGQASISVFDHKEHGKVYLSIQRDVTDHKRAEEALKESEEKFRSVYDQSPIGIELYDSKGNLIDANQECLDIFGVKGVEGVRGFKLFEDPNLSDEAKAELKKGKPLKYESKFDFELVKKMGLYKTSKSGVIYVAVQIIPWVVADKTPGYLVHVADITTRKRAEEALLESEELLRAIIDNSTSVLYLKDTQGRHILVNQAFAAMFNMPKEEIVGKTNHDLVPKEVADEITAHDQKVLKGKKPVEYEEVVPLNGEPRTYLSIKFPLLDLEGVPYAICGISTDITDRKRVEAALQESEEKYRDLVETSQDLIWKCDSEGRFVYLNPAWENLVGYKVDEMLGHPFTEFKPPEIVERDAKTFKSILKGSDTFGYETIYITKSGERKNLVFNARMRRDARGKIIGTHGTAHDITNRKIAEEAIKSSLDEKEALLKEIHHRVKNNLQIISSMLNLQSKYIGDKPTIEIFRDSQSRVRAMALVHEKLYQSKDLSQIGFSDYLKTLAAYLFQTYNVSPEVIKTKVEVKDVSLSIDTAIPCGLIINELVANSLKHAFPKGREGEILVSLKPAKGKKYILKVSDNGVGMPKGFDIRNPKSLGLQLVDNLVKQLGGAIDLDRKGGTTLSVSFARTQMEE